MALGFHLDPKLKGMWAAEQEWPIWILWVQEDRQSVSAKRILKGSKEGSWSLLEKTCPLRDSGTNLHLDLMKIRIVGFDLQNVSFMLKEQPPDGSNYGITAHVAENALLDNADPRINVILCSLL